MRTISLALANWFVAPSRSRAYCLSITRKFGSPLTVRGTSWDEDIEFGDSPAPIYYSTSGGAASDIDQSAALNVDNAEVKCNFDAITEADLKAGLWNNASFEFFVVNPLDTGMGRYRSMTGTLGNITIDRLTFLSELRSRLQRLQQSIGLFVYATCPYTLGSTARLAYAHDCQKDLTAFTVTGTAESVTADGLTWSDSARTEAGPAGGVAISSISNADPPVVVTASALWIADGAVVTLSDMVGMPLLSGPWTIRNPTGSQFELDGIDTTDVGLYGTFVSGTATPLSAESGYFAYGLMRIDSGPNAGIWREIKSSIETQWTLQTAFPFAVTGTESYTMKAGCDKLFDTCRVKFDNVVNFGGFTGVVGNDRLMQVARQQ